MLGIWQFYFLLAIILLQGILCLIQKEKIFLWVVFAELLFLSAFRSWDIGNDTIQYIAVFRNIIGGLDISQLYMEKGYVLFNIILSKITANPQSLLIVSSAFILGSWFIFIRRYTISIFLSVFIFILLSYDATLNILRQEIALGILLLALPFVQQRQFIPYALCTLIATSFHLSALAGILIYPLYAWKYNLRNILLICAGSIFCMVFLSSVLYNLVDLFGGKYAAYLGNRLLQEEIKTASIYKTFLHFSIAGFCIFSYQLFADRIHQSFPSHLPYAFLIIMVLMGACVQMISIRGPLLERVSLYFQTFEIIAIPAFSKLYPKNIRALITPCILVGFFIYTSIIFIYRPEWNHLFPYEFCF